MGKEFGCCNLSDKAPRGSEFAFMSKIAQGRRINYHYPSIRCSEGEFMSLADEVFTHSEAHGFGAELHRIERLLEVLEHTEQDSAIWSPATLARLWKRYLDVESEKRSPSDSLEKIALLSWLEDLLQEEDSNWTQAFRTLGFNFVRTRLEVRIRLGSRLFSRGRKPGDGNDARTIRKSLLPAAVRILTAAERDVRILTDNRRRMLYGMRGVARLFLGRDGVEPITMFRGATDDLLKSGEYGDHTPEHDEYLREALIKLFEFKPEQWIIDKLSPLFAGAARRTRQYYADRIRMLLGQAAATDVDQDRRSLLNDAITDANLGLRCVADLETPDAIFKYQRGFATLLLSQREAERELLPNLLKSAVDDLREGAKLGLGGASLSQTLLKLSHVTRRNDPTRALEYVREARQATGLITNAPLLERMLHQIAQNEIGVTIANLVSKEDISELSEKCHQLLSLDDEVVRPFVLSIVFAAKLLLRQGDDAAATEVGLKAVALIERIASSDEYEESPHGRYILISNAASLVRQLGQQYYDRALELYREAFAVSPGEVNGASFTTAADLALRLGKRAARAGDPLAAAIHLADSIAWYETGITLTDANPDQLFEGFMPVVCHSKAGEAYVRLQAIEPKIEYANLAISHLEKARLLGNETAELLGILGDAYYRKGIQGRDTEALFRALELKEEARRSGHVSRENWSVSASIAIKLYTYDRAVIWRNRAVEAAVEAHAVDPAWPWPLFQIAEFLSIPSAAGCIAPRMDIADRPHLAPLIRNIEEQARARIEEDAVRLAIATVEFGKRVLGGRTRVYVLDDPHGLISTTVVLKPTTLQNAEREMSALRSFGEFLTASNEQREFILPQAIAAVTQDSARAIYAMKRASGLRLSDYLSNLSGEGQVEKLTSELTRALRYLSLYHAWALGGEKPLVSSRIGKYELSRIQEGLTLSSGDAARFRQLVAQAMPMELQQLPKKDAHAENWIVTTNRLMMIDLESSGYRPILFEVAQLIDDFVAIPPDEGGFELRLDLAEMYLKSLQSLGLQTRMTRPEIAMVYSTFWLLRCAFGIGLFRRRSQVKSSSSLRQITKRHEHYRKSISYLEGAGVTNPIKELAAWVKAR